MAEAPAPAGRSGRTRVRMDDTEVTSFLEGKVALKRVGVPEDVARMYLFLASDESSFCSGAEFVCDGGATATHAYGG